MNATKRKDRMKVYFIISLSMSVISGGVVWMLSPGAEMGFQDLLMIIGLVLVIAFALFLAFRKLRDIKSDLPAEDELSKTIMRKGAATSYYISLYMWLAIMMFESSIKLERSSLIGAGILGMALIFAGSWMYHRYFSTAND